MMKQLLKLFFILILAFGSTRLYSQTVSIGATEYNTITEALTAATSGDVIEISGVHTESISIDKSVTLRGTNPMTDIIQAAETPGTASAGVINIFRPNELTDPMPVTIENLGIRNGVASDNGGGIFVDKIDAKVTLTNLIIEDNSAGKNGGGLAIAGSDADITECSIINNTSTLDGGGVLVAPNNATTLDSEINFFSSLIDSNNGRNGGGLYINGNKDFGDTKLISVYIENTTISNNSSNSGTGGFGGGAIWSRSTIYVPDNTKSNVSLQLVHATLFNNTHTSDVKNGISFTNFANNATTDFSIYNSILVTADLPGQKAINFANSATTDVVNTILGGLQNAGPFLSIIDDATKNNSKGRTATFAGLTTGLTNQGGNVQVLPIDRNSNSVNYCSAATGINLPTSDVRGIARDNTPDAGAFEFVELAPTVANAIEDQFIQTGSGPLGLDLSATFEDLNGDALALSVELATAGIVTAEFDGTTLNISEVTTGSTLVTVTADDGFGGTVSESFTVTVNTPPTVQNPIVDKIYESQIGTARISLTDVFADADGDALGYSVTSSDENVITVNIDENTNEIVVTEVAEGISTVTVTADDGNGGTVSDEFTVRIGVNNPPTVANAIVDQNVQEGFSTLEVDITNTFADQDVDDVLTYTVTVADEAVVTASISSTETTTTLTLTEVGLGSTLVTVTANDGNEGTVSEDFTINVNGTPTVSEVIADVTEDEGFLSLPVDITNTFSDADGDALTITVAVADESVVTASISSTETSTTLTLVEVGVGSTLVTVTADDGNGGTVTEEFNVTVNMTVSIEEELPGVSVYPNPFRSFLNIQVGDIQGRLNIQVMSVNGQVLREKTYENGFYNEFNIDLSGIGSGLYLLKLTDGDRKTSIQKIIKN